jgi:uncharacterized protein YcsI (UPF0317 family)
MLDTIDSSISEAYAARREARSGRNAGHTSGRAAGYVQGNVAIVPVDDAADFEAYCRANRQPCPLLAVGAPGDPALPSLGVDIDIRTDLPRYRVYRDGALAEERNQVVDLWRPDLVTFVIGCSFTFERALTQAGIPLRHVSLGRNVAMYRSSIETNPVGRFGGPMVVSMRPMLPQDAERAAEITARFPDQHGRPVHSGDPAAIGIVDIARPDYGDAVPIGPGEVPVFWACGVTSQAALERARLPFFMAHAPGAMLVTDWVHADA